MLKRQEAIPATATTTQEPIEAKQHDTVLTLY